MKFIHVIIIFSFILNTFSCKDDDFHLEQRAGHYVINKVQYSYYSDSLTSPDSIVTYEHDSLGFFNFYFSSPPALYSVLNFPSKYINPSYEGKWYIHEENQHIMVIRQLNSNNVWINYKYYVDEPTKDKQTWTFTEDFFNGKVIVEKIWVEKK